MNNFKKILFAYLPVVVVISIIPVALFLFRYMNDILSEPFSFLSTLIIMVTFLSFLSLPYSKNFRKVFFPFTSNSFEEMAGMERKAAGSVEDVNRRFDLSLERELKKAVSNIRENADSIVSDRLETLINERFGSGVARSLGSQVAKQAKDYAAQTAIDDYLQAVKSDTNNRALQYADGSHRQSAVFRMLATVLAFVGVGVALWTALNTVQFNIQIADSPATVVNIETKNIADVLYRYAPVYLVVILCEVLALILFRVSTKLSEQTRYFSNEATNNDLKFASLKLAMHFGKPADIVSMAKTLQNTERNFILDKGQKTMELASNEMEAGHLEELISKFKPVTSTKRQPAKTPRKRKPAARKT